MGVPEATFNPGSGPRSHPGSRRASVVASLKMAVDHTEEKEQELRQHDGGDYSGAHAKTDPAEIKLVKKLDLWIMVRIPNHSHYH